MNFRHKLWFFLKRFVFEYFCSLYKFEITVRSCNGQQRILFPNHYYKTSEKAEVLTVLYRGIQAIRHSFLHIA